jgi:hypothetical protein
MDVLIREKSTANPAVIFQSMWGMKRACCFQLIDCIYGLKQQKNITQHLSHEKKNLE